MRLRASDLWRWDGELERGPYVLWGGLLVAVKFNLDRWLLRLWWGQDWSLLDYLNAGGLKEGGAGGGREEQLWLLVCALPFLWAGVGLTLRRLRSLGWPLGWVVLFVVPILKWFFFGLLACVRRSEGDQVPASPSRGSSWLERCVPASKFGSAALGVVVSVLLGLGATALSATLLQQYGFGLFVGLPFVMGLSSVLVYGRRERRRLRECLGVAALAVGLAALALLALAFEGVICLLMAAPLACVLSMIGGVAGYCVQAQRWRRDADSIFCAAFLALPLSFGVELLEPSPAPLLAVTSAVDIEASPEVVWRHVVSFSELPPPTEWLFRAGVAYPLRAVIYGRGVGAERHCVFSTGPFVEPIEVWDEPNLLKFSVTRNPAPMQEWTPYREVHPPHLDGFLASSGGQFKLVRRLEGGTRLEGTTWYRHHMWPVGYWQAWSDAIIHRIHLRVLNHVKQLSERELVGTENQPLKR